MKVSMMFSNSMRCGSAAVAGICLAALVLFSGTPLLSSAQADEMEPEPTTVLGVLDQMNGLAIDEEGEPTGAPTYGAMASLLLTSGAIDSLGLGANFTCNVPEDAMSGEEAVMADRPPMTIVVPSDAALGALSDDVTARLAGDPAAGAAFVAAHAIANEVRFATVRGQQRWFRTMAGDLLQVSGLQGTMVFNPASSSVVWPDGAQSLCVENGPIVVMIFTDKALTFDLPDPEEA